jgi:predicted transposase YdaD
LARAGPATPVLYAFPKHDILKEFLEKNATEVLGMLMKEWNWDDALAVRYREGREGGREEGIEEVARNALMNGFSIDQIQVITGLDADTIRNLETGVRHAS